MIDSERDYVDERLCGVNDMTFEEWERYQDYMIKYYGGYFGDGLYDYEDYESNKEDDWKKTNHRTKTMNGTRTVEVALATMTFV